jgi:hypothetical protein
MAGISGCTRTHRGGDYARPMGDLAYVVKALDESTWPAFAALVERNNGIFGGCWCLGFHPAQSFTDVP